MKFHRTTFPLIALAVGTAGIAVAQAQGPYQPFNGSPAAAFVQDHQDDWDAPPQEFREIQRRDTMTALKRPRRISIITACRT
jgi:hypothetical protein